MEDADVMIIYTQMLSMMVTTSFANVDPSQLLDYCITHNEVRYYLTPKQIHTLNDAFISYLTLNSLAYSLFIDSLHQVDFYEMLFFLNDQATNARAIHAAWVATNPMWLTLVPKIGIFLFGLVITVIVEIIIALLNLFF